MGFGSFCVGGERSVHDSGRDFQAKFNETFETRFRLEPKDSGLVAKVTVCSSSRLRLAHLRSSSHTMSLMPGQSASTDKKQYLVTFQAEGTSIIRQNGREARAIPGSLFLLDACKPFQVDTSVVSLQSVYVPADVLQEALPGVDCCTAVVLPTSNGAGRIMRVAFEELFDPASTTDEEGLSRIASMLPPALAVAFGHLTCRLSLSRDDHQRERIKNFVRRNLRNPRLTTSFIANGVGLSIRRLHELFASEPETLMRWTRAERLKRINKELTDPALVERPIANIAYDWGFKEPSHFSRTFRTEYGVSPRIVRDRIRFTRAEASRIPLGRPWLNNSPPRKANATLTCGDVWRVFESQKSDMSKLCTVQEPNLGSKSIASSQS